MQYGWFIIRIVAALVISPVYAQGGTVPDTDALVSNLMKSVSVESPLVQSARIIPDASARHGDQTARAQLLGDADTNVINNHPPRSHTWFMSCWGEPEATRLPQPSSATRPTGTVGRMLEQRLRQISFFVQAFLGDQGEIFNAYTLNTGTAIVGNRHDEYFPTSRWYTGDHIPDVQTIGFRFTFALDR